MVWTKISKSKKVGWVVAMFRAVITLGDLKYLTKNFDTKIEAENWILEVAEKQKVKRADILDKQTKTREKAF